MANKQPSLSHFLLSDARHYQILFLTLFLCYGIYFLGWNANWKQYFITFLFAIITQLGGIYWKNQPYSSLKSALITALSLSILFKANSLLIVALAATLAIGSKFLFRHGKKHFFNPANFGIIATILLTNNAWISPGQWGNSATILFLVGSLGLWVLYRVGRFDLCFAFLGTFGTLQFYRQILYLGWTTDVWVQQMTSGSLLLFSFFMITDPVSTPNNQYARIIWAMLLAVVAYILSVYYFINATPVWTLFFFSPLTPLFDKIFQPQKRFSWAI